MKHFLNMSFNAISTHILIDLKKRVAVTYMHRHIRGETLPLFCVHLRYWAFRPATMTFV